MTKELEILKKLTDELTPLSDLAMNRGHVIEYEIEGKCIGFGLHNNGKIAVQRAFMSAGSRFVPHTHAAVEWLIVYEGRLKIHYDDSDKPDVYLSPSDGISFQLGELHSVIALEDTELIGIVIPSEEGYPDA